MFAGLLVVCRLMGADEPLVLSVWPGDVPGDYGTIGPERVRAPSEAPTKDAKWITNVTKPTVAIFQPPKEKNNATAIVICPGGGYWNLAWDLEGEEVAAWLNTIGVTGVVLKYRVPRRGGQPERLPAPGPLLDAQRAVSLVRSRAADWGIDTNRIGILGNSLGGTLAIEFAAGTPGVRAVVANSAFSSLTDTLETSLRFFTGLPSFPFAPLITFFAEREARIRVADVDATRWIGRLSPRPVFLMQGGSDVVISRQSGQRLFDAAGEPRELWYEPKIAHSGFDNALPEEYERRVVGFFTRYLLGP